MGIYGAFRHNNKVEMAFLAKILLKKGVLIMLLKNVIFIAALNIFKILV
jgi:hypothetical protein